jgi:hypothetical protein
MTDTQSLIPISLGLTDDLLYYLKKSSGRGRSYRCSVQPTNAQTFAPGSTTILYIPCGRKSTFLDTQQSYIKFTLQNNDTNNTINVDGCAASLINRIDTFHASNPLESIIQYNVLYNFLMDFQTNSAQKMACSNHMGFSNNNNLAMISSVASGAVAVGLNIGTATTGIRDGAKLPVAPAANTPSKLTFCLPVLSGDWGMLLDKMLPVGALNDDIRIEITWEQQLLGVVYNTLAATNAQVAWSITGVELELCYVELADDSMQIINSVSPLNCDIYLHGKSYRHYVSTLPLGTSGQ